MQDCDALDDLIDRWGRWYAISFHRGIWHAERRDDGGQAHRLEPEALDREIERNYLADPVIVPAK